MADMASHHVCLPLADATASASFPLARRPRLTSVPDPQYILCYSGSPVCPFTTPPPISICMLHFRPHCVGGLASPARTPVTEPGFWKWGSVGKAGLKRWGNSTSFYLSSPLPFLPIPFLHPFPTSLPLSPFSALRGRLGVWESAACKLPQLDLGQSN